MKGRDVATIGKPDMLAIVDRIADSGAVIMSRRVHAHLNRLFEWAVGRSIVTTNPVSGVQKHGKETKRDRVLTDAELVKIWNGNAGDPYNAAIKLLLLTGARKMEIGGLRWSEIDADTITLPAERVKNGKAHIIPLSQPAKDILAKLPRIGDHVFTKSGRTACGAWDEAKARLGKDAGLTDWTIHDLRRTVSTGMNEHGADPHIVEAVLGHTIKGVAGVYNRAKYEAAKRAALEAWAAHIMGLVS